MEYIIGKTVEHFEQDDKQVVASFSGGSSGTFDVLVGADDQCSRFGELYFRLTLRILTGDWEYPWPTGLSRILMAVITCAGYATA